MYPLEDLSKTINIPPRKLSLTSKKLSESRKFLENMVKKGKSLQKIVVIFIKTCDIDTLPNI